MPKKLKVIEVDGDIYLGIIEKNKEATVISNAIGINMKFDENFNTNAAIRWFQKENLRELLNLTLGSSQGYIVRPLTLDEKNRITKCEERMLFARQISVRYSENQLFEKFMNKE